MSFLAPSEISLSPVQLDQSPDGQTFVERYQVNDFPHISIIDPRTGRLLWRKEGWTQQNPMTSLSFAEMAMDFCSRNTFDRPPQAPRPAGASASSSSSARPSQKRPVQEMTEDEQLQAAMRASVQEMGPSPAGSDGADDELEVIEVVDDQEDSKPSPKKKSSLLDELLGLQVSDEPSAGARLQLRMADGKKIVRKFAPTDTVKMVYAFVAVSRCAGLGLSLTLFFMAG